MSEHELDRGLIEPIVEDLRHIAEGSVLVDSGRFCMYVRTFTVAMRRHLNWENRVVLPLARRVLSKEDRALLRDGIADRRRCLSPGGS
jgi:hemerythrin-like domain-containing protein